MQENIDKIGTLCYTGGVTERANALPPLTKSANGGRTMANPTLPPESAKRNPACAACGRERVHGPNTRMPLNQVTLCKSCAAKERWRRRKVGNSQAALTPRRAGSLRYNRANVAKLKLYHFEYGDRLRAEAIDAYGGKCEHCAETDPVVLVIDHTNDDGAAERASGLGGLTLIRWLKRNDWPKGRHQLLCHNCNARKEHRRRMAARATVNHGGPVQHAERAA